MEQKHGALLMWLVLAVGMLLGTGWVANVARYAFWGIALIHLVEFFVKRSVMEKADGSLGQHFVQTMIYGFMHWKPLEDKQRAG